MNQFEYTGMSWTAVSVVILKCKRNNIDFKHTQKSKNKYDIIIYTSRNKWQKMT